MTGVTGEATADNTTGNYAGNIQYRAFGQIKQMDYLLPTETPEIKLGYDNRLRVNHSEVTKPNGFVMKADFAHGNDSRVTAKNDLLDDKWDRSMKYDFAGRLTFAQFGMGIGTSNQNKRVYEESIQYDGFSMMNDRQTNHWENDSGFAETYVNGRISSFNGNYDAAGNIIRQGDVQSDPHTYVDTNYDAAGRRTRMFDKRKGKFGNVLNMIQEHLSEFVFDGDGRPVIEKEGFQTYHVNDTPPSSPLTATAKMYQVWSTVLGSNLTTVKPDGTKWETKIFAGGAVIAKEGATGAQWVTSDPVTGTTVTWRKIDNDWLTSVEETEPLGQKIYNADPDPLPEPSYDNSVGNADFPQWQCKMPSKFYGNFYAMPWHCQFAEIKRRSFEGGHYVIEEPETNPNKVSGHTTGSAGPATPTGSAGHEARHIMAFSRLMNFTLGATRKPTKDTGEQTGEDDDDDPIRIETHTSTAIISNRGEKGSGIGKPPETGWTDTNTDNDYSNLFISGGKLSKEEFEVFTSAKKDAESMLNSCGSKLEAAFQKRTLIIDLKRLRETIGSLVAKDRESESNDIEFNVFVAERTQFKKTDLGKAGKSGAGSPGSASFVLNYGYPLFLNLGFFEAVTKNDGLDVKRSRAILLIHEALHLNGWKHDGTLGKINNSAEFTQIILDSCAPGYKRNDLSVSAN